MKPLTESNLQQHNAKAPLRAAPLPPLGAPSSSRACTAARSQRVGLLGGSISTVPGFAIAGSRPPSASTYGLGPLRPAASSVAPSSVQGSVRLPLHASEHSAALLAALEQQLAEERAQRLAMETRLENLAALFEQRLRGNGGGPTPPVISSRPGTAVGAPRSARSLAPQQPQLQPTRPPSSALRLGLPPRPAVREKRTGVM